MLKFVESTRQEHIVSWVNKGVAFKVHDFKEFERHLLPNYFSATKYTSFTRALHAYGFKCERSGRQTGVFSHPWFNRNEIDMLSRMKRAKPPQKNQAKAAIAIHAPSSAATSASRWMSNELQTPRNLKRLARQRPSNLDYMMASNNCHQVVDRTATTSSLSRTRDEDPAGLQLFSPIDSNSGSMNLEPSTWIPFVLSFGHSRPSSSTNTTDQQTDDVVRKPTSPPRISILDDRVAPIALSFIGSGNKQDGQKLSEEVLFSTREEEKVGSAGDHFYRYNCISSKTSLEPRSIQAMKKSPSNMNQYARFCSLFLDDNPPDG